MTAVYRTALGGDFDNLHPNLQWRYSIDSASGVAQMVSGIMDSVYCSPKLPGPVKSFHRRRHSLAIRSSRLVPFEQGNYCYRDELGRECLAVLRTFGFGPGDQYLNSVLVDDPTGLVDYFGDGPEYLYPITPSVTVDGGLLLETGPMRWTSTVGPNIGLRGLLELSMRYREWWQDDEDRFRCEAVVTNPIIGEVFHYRGWFTAVDRPCTIGDIPDEAWPLRLERRTH
ncbi:hypothetical protein GCM10027169_06180 [Gordonia jinhuaensis]|uniref:DUF4166 domain-containing protein n=1 Tax=Gordonia jinhuaensis TaxID=1517702 RepID=A0A916SVY7_9ACTN|nr:DUF4166 domain-containing protein [Gordonia jinhuaensis]GGB20508.1 hypothetical protein GCM10011489_05790 [Gordonia jinhuaensis]